jgi:hypothetical protein
LAESADAGLGLLEREKTGTNLLWYFHEVGLSGWQKSLANGI